MKKLNSKYVYGPVYSWRLGRSLGIDLISQHKKICSFDCVYCQVVETSTYQTKRKVFVSTRNIIKELKKYSGVKVDYITFSGRGEPTLAKNLGKVIKAIKRIRKEPVAVLTNSSLIKRRDVQRDLMLSDFVLAKLDSTSSKTFQSINKMTPQINFKDITNGLITFRKKYKKKLALQIMFMKQNKHEAKKLAGLAAKIQADEVQINTPLRPSPVKPLSKKEIAKIEKFFNFKNIKVVSVYRVRRKKRTK